MMRVLGFTTPDGSGEYVVFLDDDDTDDALDHQIGGYDLSFDQMIDGDLPSGFPIGYELHRR